MKRSKARESHSEDPLTPGSVLAHMVVSIVLLGGVWGIEWVKSHFEHGVPTLAAASIATGELAMFAYFLGALVRACKWAFSEFDQAFKAIQSAHILKDAKRAMSALGRLLVEAIPSTREMLRASRFMILLAVLAVGAVVVWTVVGIFATTQANMNRSSNTPPANRNSNLNSNSNRNANNGMNVNAGANTNSSTPIEFRKCNLGLLSKVISLLLTVFDHSDSVAIAGSVLVGLVILTFLLVELFRAYGHH